MLYFAWFILTIPYIEYFFPIAIFVNFWKCLIIHLAIVRNTDFSKEMIVMEDYLEMHQDGVINSDLMVESLDMSYRQLNRLKWLRIMLFPITCTLPRGVSTEDEESTLK
jgi:hypothetical protein